MAKYSELVVALTGIIVACMILTAAIISTNRFADNQRASVNNFLNNLKVAESSIVSVKLDHVMLEVASKDWSIYLLKLGIALILTVILGILVLIWLESSLEKDVEGFILLNKESEDAQKLYLRRQQHKFLQAIAALVSNIAVGIAANFLFLKLG
jgi:hypothetical protein